MNNKVVFEVYVDDNGTLKAATQGVKGLGAEVNKTASAHKNASKEADGHFNRQEKGIIGTANSTKGFSKLAQSINGGSNSLVGAYATLAANVFAVSAAFLALKDAAQFQQVEAGIKSMGNAMGVTLSLTTKKVQELSGGLLTAQQAATSTAQVISAGFKTKDLERITVVARQASLTLGRDMTDSVDRLTRGVIKLEPELLDELGIMTRLDEASKIYALQNGKVASALTTTEKRQAFLNATLAEGELKFGGITGDDKLNNLAKLGTSFQNLTKDIFTGINFIALPLAGLFDNKGLLLAGMVLFASTISKQLLPGLAQVQTQAVKSAEALTKLARAEAIAAKIDGGATKGFSKFKRSVKDGTATPEAISEAWLKSRSDVVRETDKLKSIQDNATASQISNSNKLIAKYTQQAEVTKQLAIVSAKAAAERSVSSAIGNATAGGSSFKEYASNTKKAFVDVKAATQNYKVALEAAAASSTNFKTSSSAISTSLIALRTGMYATAVSANVLGAALLEMIPIIGQVILVVTLLWTGLNYLYTKIVGAGVIQARKDLDTIRKAFADKLTEIEKVKKASVSAAIQEQKLASITTNSIVEIADAYAKVNAEKQKGLDAKYTKDLANQNARIATGSRSALLEPKAQRKTATPDSGLKDIENIKKINPLVAQYTDSLIKLNGGQEAVNKSTTKQAAIIQLVSIKFANLGPTIDDLVDSFKVLEDSYSGFIKTMTPTTPYDTLSASLNKTRGALVSASLEMSKGTMTSEEFAKSLTTMGANTLNQMPAKVQALSKSYLELIATRAKLKELELSNVTSGTEVSTLKTKELSLQTSITANSKESLSLAISTVFAEDEKYAALQEQSILYQGILALAQSHLSVLGNYTDLSGKGTADRLRGENTVKSLQSQQLMLQANILKALVAQQEVNLSILDADIRRGEVLKNQLNSVNDITKLQTLLALSQTQKKDSAELAATQKEIALVNDRINQERIINSQKASITANINMARAAASGANSESYIALSKQAVLTKTLATIQANETANKEASNKNAQSAIDLQKVLNGATLTSVDTYNKVLATQEATLASKKAAIDADTKAAVAEFNKEKQRARDSNAADTATRALNDQFITQAILKGALAKQVLDTQATLDKLSAAGVKTETQVLEARQDITNELLKQVELKGQLIDAELSLTKSAKKNSLGRDLTTIEEAKINSAYLDKRKKAIDEETKIKVQLIDLEYTLLEAKLRISRAESILQRQLLADAGANIDAYDILVNSMDKLIGGAATQPAILKTKAAANDNEVSPAIVNANQAKGLTLGDARNTATNLAKAQGAVAKDNVSKESNIDRVTKGVVDTNSTNKFDQLGVMAATAVEHLSPLTEALRSFGPEGELMLAVQEGAIAIADSISIIGKAGFSSKEGIAASLEAGVQMVSQLSNILAAGSKAKIAGIDAEISAEQKRDGKSAASVAKIASLEKTKDAAQKKAFEVNKKMMMAQTVMSTASAIMMALATYPGPAGIIMSAAYGAIGAAQLAIIAGSSYQSSTSSTAATAVPSSLSIGTRSNSVDLAKNNSNAGGESGYVTGAMGQGTNASNFKRAAYGGRAGIIVGEKGPEKIYPDVSSTVVSNDVASKESNGGVNASFTIQAVDAEGVEKVLLKNRGAIISMLREAANSNGQTFLENVNVAKYKQGGSRL
jgi:DNA-binding protein